MLSLSPATTSLLGSPSSAPKRDKPHDHDSEATKPKPRPKGPFLDDSDDESDREDGVQNGEPSPKRRMLQQSSEETAGEARAEVGEAASSTETSEPVPETLQPSFELPETLHSWSSQRPLFTGSLLGSLAPSSYSLTTCNGVSVSIKERQTTTAPSYESMVASRSRTKEGRAKRSYYGIDIHELMANASKEIAAKRSQPAEVARPSVEPASAAPGKKAKKTLLWTEKYRARSFMDLCGDDGTNRLVLRWLKRWDPVVFPGAARSKPVIAKRTGATKQYTEEEKPHRKILMLTGPPGLGKTTLAHVCARQAGYEVLEINASDDRSRDVVKNRIRTSLGTESIKTVSNRKDGDGPQKAAKPVCVVVDEVDGVVSGSGGSGEGGFVKALIDLINLDQRNSAAGGNTSGTHRRKKKEDDFRLMRPIILICNDVYHPSLRPLRQSNLAEIIHVGKPTIDAVVGRLKAVFEKEAIPCDKDAARKLCEAAWGMTSGIDAKRGAESTVQGDLRGIMVVGEWVAARFKSSNPAGSERLTRQWIEQTVLHDLANGAAGARGVGRGSVKDIVSRLFLEGGGFPKQAMDFSSSKNKHEQPKTELGFGEQQKKHAMERLRQMADTSGDISHILTEVFSEYPNREFNDDCYLTKPNRAYDWLHFHDACQSRLYASQEWELAPYLSQPVLACHHLFASPKRYNAGGAGYDKRWGAEDDAAAAAPMPFTGPRADYMAHEAEKHNRSQLQAIQAQLSPTLGRSFRSVEDVATEFLPYLVRLVSPDVKPVVVGGSAGSTASVRKESERAMVRHAAEVLADVGVALHKGRIEGDESNRTPQFVYRMDPDLDALSTFETGATLLSSQAPVRFAVRQVLDQELQRAIAARENLARLARFKSGGAASQSQQPPPSSAVAAYKAALFDQENLRRNRLEQAKTATMVKRDFFGRVVESRVLAEVDVNSTERRAKEERKAWVTFNEGLNNAVRKPMSLQDFLRAM